MSRLPHELANGTYIVGGHLGHGGFGTIHVGLQVKPTKLTATTDAAGRGPPNQQTYTLPRPVAVKRLPDSEWCGSHSIGVAATAVREIKYLTQLTTPPARHKNIVDLYDVVADGGHLFLLLELCLVDLGVIIYGGQEVRHPSSGSSGSSASTTAAPLPALPACDIKAYAKAVLDAVAHCHAHGVVHQDLKPDNFFLSSGGVLKLGDFGLARRSGTSPKSPLRARACVWYRAPEVLYGSKEFTPQIDAWAVGCILAEMVRDWTGRGPHVVAVLAARMNE